MILAAALCPHPPLLLRELTGLHDPVPELRAACLDVVAAALDTGPDLVVVVGGVGQGEPPIGRRYGGPELPEAGLPLSHAVGRRLLAEAGWSGPVRYAGVDPGGENTDVEQVALGLVTDERVVLLVLADGSARRGEKAPGFLDERAFPYDAAVVAALRDGDAPALLDLDVALAAELMVQGRAALQVLGAVVAQQGGGPPKARLAYADDPFGVMYPVALWQLG